MNAHKKILVLFMMFAVLSGGLISSSAEAKLYSKEITYQADVSLKGFLIHDDGTKELRPAVIVIHEWWGHNDYARKRATMLAKQGYIAFALDMFGDGKNTTHPDQAMGFVKETTANFETAKLRFDAAKNFLKKYPFVDPKRIAVIGYCFGGGTALNLARLGEDVQAVASFHGSLESSFKAKRRKTTAKLLILNGAADPMVTPEAVTAFKKEMDKAKVDYEFVNYPGVKHAFTNPAATKLGKTYNLPLVYDAKADADSWQRLTSFLKTVFEKK